MTETPLSQEIRIAASVAGHRLFRNNVGALQDKTGRWVYFGLCEGSGDLIGWKARLITLADVGKTIAQFASVEVKRHGGRTERRRAGKQGDWRDAVLDAGGVATIAYSVEDAIAAMEAGNEQGGRLC